MLRGKVGWVILVAWLGWVFDIMDTALFNFAKAPMLKEMLGEAGYKAHGTAIEGWIQTVFLVGWSLGGLFFGLLADRWGRRRTLILTVAAYSVLTGLTALCRTPTEVAVLRFLTALGIGGEWAAGAALVAESVPNEFRSRAAAILQSAAAFGPWFAAAANLAIPVGSWRALFFVGVLPALLCVALRFVASDGEQAPAKDAGRFEDLVKTSTLRRNLAVAIILGVVGITGAGILPYWLPNLIDQAGLGLAAEAKKAFLSYNTFTLHIGTLAGVFAFPWLADKIGRREAFALFFALAPIAATTALYGGASYERLLILLPVAAFFSIGVSAGFALYFPELFPAKVRATGSGLAYNAGRVVSAPVPAVMGSLMGPFGPAGVVMAAGLVYVFGLAALPFARETKGETLAN
jgi:MFS family permease